ncbi:MAG: homocysteine S-methyltransferase family protein [Lachnospiraceae bacterium]|nr:homocysteine S-methyltransferase family protein [Lachnospiraceae bacterium]
MKKAEFREFLKDKIVYLDGATGSNLMKAGMPVGVCPEQWILEHPDALVKLQSDYVAAGSNIVYAPTFTANRIKLAEYGFEDRLVEMNTELVKLSKKAVAGKALVAGDLTMTGKQLKPIGPLEFEELVDVYKEQIRALSDAGADLLIIETMMSLQETRACAIAAMEVCDLPVMATLTFETDGRTLFGSDPKSAAITLSHLHVDAIGANCSTGPDQMCAVISAMAEVTDIPLVAKPNAGLPSLDADGNTVYDMDAETFSEEMRSIVEAGASVLGGCCGTSPAYIRLLVEKTRSLSCKRKEITGRHFLCSERQSLEFGLDDPFMIVGERINPTGKKKLQAELREGKLDLVEQFAEEQEACGAKILDVNCGMSGIDEKETLIRVMEDVANVTNLPLSIDSSHVDVIEAALRRYPGRALINSISFESEKVDKLLPIAEKYGAMFILLPLSDAGLPKDMEEKKHIIEEVLQRAFALGIKKDDIVVDGLVGTIAANSAAGQDTLNTIRYCKENGLATICGLSNISFGMPERMAVNTAFLTMAIQNGLTMAIANPNQEMLVRASLASDLLRGKPGADMTYIDYVNTHTYEAPTAKKVVDPDKMSVARPTDIDDSTPIGKVKKAVLNGKQRDIKELTKEAVDSGIAPQKVLDDALLPAIAQVGDLFDSGKYFLPQLIASAEAMKASIEYLEPLLQKEGATEVMPTIVIATVKGDIHDIGKNLVAMMLKNNGFTVVDLGKDVPREEIIRAAKENNAKIIALSALMTTTMREMKNVIDLAKEEGLKSKFMIGGAVITEDYADEIGADGYSKDAANAVKLAKKLSE